MRNKTLEHRTDTQTSPSPYQAERAEIQEKPVLRPDPLGATLAPPGSEATLQAHAASLNRATPGPALRRLQRQYGNRYVQRVVELVQRRASGEGFTLDEETAGRIHRARGGGQPLDGAVQAEMGETLGHDFSGVRVHTDPEADALNRQLSASAFTTGQDIFFRRGEYNPGSDSGQELIAHELTHVVQQSTDKVCGEGGGMTVRPAGDAFEQEAGVMGREATQTKSVSAQQRAVAAPADILALQRSYGNQAVKQLHDQRSRETGAGGPHGSVGKAGAAGGTTASPAPVDRTHTGKDMSAERGQKHSISSQIAKTRPSKEETEYNIERFHQESIQRRIVTERGQDGSEELVILGSIGAYLKEQPSDEVELLGAARYDTIGQGEPLYIIAHGSPTKVGGRSDAAMVDELTTQQRKLPEAHEKIRLAACEAGKDVQNIPSYAMRLQQRLRAEKYDLVEVSGPPGIAVTNIESLTEMIVRDLPEAQKIQARNMREPLKKFIEKQLIQNYPDIKERAKAAIAHPYVKEMFTAFIKEKATWAQPEETKL